MHSLPAEIVSIILKKSIQFKPDDFKNLMQVSTFWNTQCTLFKPFAQQLLSKNELNNLKNVLKKIEDEKSAVLNEKFCFIDEINWVERKQRALINTGFQTDIKLSRDNFIKICQSRGDAGAFELVKMHFSKLSKAKFNSIGLEDHEFYKAFFTLDERSLTKGFALLTSMNKSIKVEKLLNLQADSFFAELLQEEDEAPLNDQVSLCR